MWTDWTLSAAHMPSQQAAAFLVRAAPLTFALLWSSGFIVAKYAAPDADPFTFLTVRFAVAAVLLMVIAVASQAPWPASAGETAHSLMAGVLLHGGYRRGRLVGGRRRPADRHLRADHRRPAAAHRGAGRPAARRAGHAAAVGWHRGGLRRHRAGAGAAARRRRCGDARRRGAADHRQCRRHGFGDVGHVLPEALRPARRSAQRNLPAIRRRARGGGAARARHRDAAIRARPPLCLRRSPGRC